MPWKRTNDKQLEKQERKWKMLVMEVRECNRVNTCPPGDATGQGGQHTGAGWPVLIRFLFWLWKSLFLPEQWNWPKKPPLLTCLPGHPQGGQVHFCSIYCSSSVNGPELSSASNHHFRQISLAIQPTMRMSFTNNPSIIHLLKKQSQLDTSWAPWVSEAFLGGWEQQWIVLHIYCLCACGIRSLILELFLFSSVCFSYFISDLGPI